MKRYQPTLLSCDWCQKEESEDTAFGWVQVAGLGGLRSFADPLHQDMQFCSMWHAAEKMLQLAARHEPHRQEALKALVRET